MTSFAASSTDISKNIISFSGKNRRNPDVGFGVVGKKILNNSLFFPIFSETSPLVLVDTNAKLATASESVSTAVDDFHGILAFGSSQKVTPNTTAFTVRFDVTNGTAAAKTGGGSSVYIGLGPFDMSIAIQ